MSSLFRQKDKIASTIEGKTLSKTSVCAEEYAALLVRLQVASHVQVGDAKCECGFILVFSMHKRHCPMKHNERRTTFYLWVDYCFAFSGEKLTTWTKSMDRWCVSCSQTENLVNLPCTTAVCTKCFVTRLYETCEVKLPCVCGGGSVCAVRLEAPQGRGCVRVFVCCHISFEAPRSAGQK